MTQGLPQYYADYHIDYKVHIKSTYSEPHLCQTSRILFKTHRYVQIHGRQVLIKSRYQIQERRMHHKNKKVGKGEDTRKSSDHHAIHASRAIVKMAGFFSELCFDMTGGVRRSRSNGE